MYRNYSELMKPYFYRGILLVFFILISSCANDKSQNPLKKQERINIDKGQNLDKTKSRISVQFSDVKVNDAYDSYLLIKAAMVNSNSKAVQGEASKLEVISRELTNAKELKAVTKLISLTKDIKKQRDFFATLTSEFEKLIKSTTIKSGEVYKQFCPMAFNGEGGYWLSDSKEVRNPYFGKEMLVCGNVKEVIR